MRTLLLPFALLLLLTGCDEDPVSSNASEMDLALQTAADLPADPQRSGVFTFYDLESGETVPRADSATTDWDIAFAGTTILTNSGTSGPGDAAAAVIEQPFSETTEVPEDVTLVADAEGAPAIPTGSGNGWYSYDRTTHSISPLPGRTILLRTTEGNHAKLRMISYYRGAPEELTADAESRYLTFDYVLQTDGSARFAE